MMKPKMLCDLDIFKNKKGHNYSKSSNYGKCNTSKKITKVQNYRTLKETIDWLKLEANKPTLDYKTMKFSANFWNNFHFLKKAIIQIEMNLNNESTSIDLKQENLEYYKEVAKLLIFYGRLSDEYEYEFDSFLTDDELIRYYEYDDKSICLNNNPLENAKELRLKKRKTEESHYECIIKKYSNHFNVDYNKIM